MPNRIIRENILTSVPPLRRSANGQIFRQAIPLAVRKRLRALPCVICGVPYGIKIDHIISVARGGSGAEANLQPLCHDCNHIKHSSRTNEQVRDLVRARGLDHFVRALWREDTRCYNHYDGIDPWRLPEVRRARMGYAQELRAAFLEME